MARSLRVLAFSDLHGDRRAAERIVRASRTADLVVGAGDFATRREGGDEVLRVLAACHAPVVVVHGNHDEPDALRAAAKGLGLVYLHGDVLQFGDVEVFGLGGEIPSRSEAAWNVSETEAAAAELLARCPVRALLVTHTPPFGCADLQRDGTHQGSYAVREAVRTRSPVACLSGHIHFSWGTAALIERTPVFNLGPAARRIRIDGDGSTSSVRLDLEESLDESSEHGGLRTGSPEHTQLNERGLSGERSEDDALA